MAFVISLHILIHKSNVQNIKTELRNIYGIQLNESRIYIFSYKSAFRRVVFLKSHQFANSYHFITSYVQRCGFSIK